MFDAEFLGEANLARKLADARSRAEAAMQKRLEELADEIVDEAKALAPEDTGGLKDSIRWEPDEDEGSGVIILAGGTPETDRTTSSGAAFDLAVLQEYGTTKMPANPFFAPAINSYRPRIERETGEAATDAIIEALGE